MTMPSPFELGRAIGGNISGGLRAAQEQSALDQIISQASSQGTPEEQSNVMNMILSRLSPEKQKIGMQILKNKFDQIQTQQQQKQHEQIAQKIESSNPDSAYHKSIADIYRSNLPIEHKEKLVRGVSGTAPLREQQQRRLFLQDRAKRYNYAIKDAKDALKNAGDALSGERNKIKEQIKNLSNERDSVLDEYENLSKSSEKSHKNKESRNIEIGLPKFDENNQQHANRFLELDQEFKGDDEALRAALFREFSI